MPWQPYVKLTSLQDLLQQGTILDYTEGFQCNQQRSVCSFRPLKIWENQGTHPPICWVPPFRCCSIFTFGNLPSGVSANHWKNCQNMSWPRPTRRSAPLRIAQEEASSRAAPGRTRMFLSGSSLLASTWDRGSTWQWQKHRECPPRFSGGGHRHQLCVLLQTH